MELPIHTSAKRILFIFNFSLLRKTLADIIVVQTKKPNITYDSILPISLNSSTLAVPFTPIMHPSA